MKGEMIEMMAQPAESGIEMQSTHREMIEYIIEHESITTFFQPIISLRERKLIGVEALSRGYFHGEMIEPMTLFQIAEEQGRLAVVDALCTKKAVTAFAMLTQEFRDNALLFLNISTSLFDYSHQNASLLENLLKENSLSFDRIVLEILESETLNSDKLVEFTEHFRNLGALIALDDVGSGASNLSRMISVRPDIIKIDRSLVAEIFQDHIKQRVVSSLTTMGHQIGAQVLAEGIERTSEGVTCHHFDVDMVQGFLFGIPTPSIEQDVESLHEMWQKVMQTYCISSIKTITRKKQRYARFRLAVQNISSDLDPDNLEESLEKAFEEAHREFPDLECAYLINREGIQVTNTIGLTKDSAISHGNVFFRPAEKHSNHSMKHYFMTIYAGAEQYFSNPYISQATGSLCLTMAMKLSGYLDNNILCADFHTPLWDKI